MSEIIIELLKEVREEQKDQSKSLTKLEVDVARNADDLKDHMRRTDILEGLHLSNQTRIETLEEPTKVRKYIIKRVLIIGSIAGAIVAIAKAFNVF